jgi:hypothetical protein
MGEEGTAWSPVRGEASRGGNQREEIAPSPESSPIKGEDCTGWYPVRGKGMRQGNRRKEIGERDWGEKVV